MPSGNDYAATFSAYRTALIKLATPILGCPMHAEDVVQEPFLRVTERTQNSDPIRHPVAFIFQVVRHLAEFEDGLRLDRERGVFIYSVKSSPNVRGRIGDTRVFLSAFDGSDLGFTHPYARAGNAVSQWLSALHAGRVGGWPYRVFPSVMGLVVALLSATGVIIWWKKRTARIRSARLKASGRG